jgi:hypothetical protein
MNSEYVRILKEMTVALSAVISHTSPGKTKKDHENINHDSQ